MLAIITHTFPFKKKEMWFYNGEPVNEVAYTTYCYVKGNFNVKFDYLLQELTTILYLNQSEEKLFQDINNTFKYEIRKAAVFDFKCQFITKPTLNDCKGIISLFKKFAKEKRIIPMNKHRIFALQKAEKIIISKIFKNNIDIITHIYLFDERRVLLMHSFHNLQYSDNALRGYANKYLHWQDILFFKRNLFEEYDFGGIEPEKVPGISRFKLNFGGKTEPVNSYIRIVPALKLFFQIYKLFFSK